MLVQNPRAVRAPYSPALQDIMNIARVRENRHWLATWTQLNPAPTPLWQMPGLAQRLGLASIVVKDESSRSPLGSFKALGASVALLRLIHRLWPDAKFQAADLLAASHADALKSLTVISATDGNHGRSLAAAAQSVGCRCVIVLHREVSEEREAPIAALGAEIVRIAGNYDDSVQEAARLAAQHGWQVVSDTSYPGYEEIPRDVMQGYGSIVDELLEQAGAAAVHGVEACPWTHVLLQGGVGGLAAGIVSYFCERYSAARPIFVVVEPEQADCLQQSALLGRPARATGSVDSLMAGLACGETSPLAWRFLENAVDFFLTIGDEDAVQAMRVLAEGADGDVPVVGGESGAAGLAGLLVLMQSEALRAEAALNAQSKVLLINTEGATAPALYQSLVGRSADAVLAAQARHTRKG